MGCAPRCPHCGGESIGWGWYTRSVRLGDLKEAVVRLRVKRFRCKKGKQTFSLLPAFVLVLKRYAAGIIQGVWEDYVTRSKEEPGSRSLEAVAERWGLPCAGTLQRWLAPLRSKGESLKRELRKVLPYRAPGDRDSETHATDEDELLGLARQVAEHTPCAPFDRSRVPYHFVLCILRG